MNNNLKKSKPYEGLSQQEIEDIHTKGLGKITNRDIAVAFIPALVFTVISNHFPPWQGTMNQSQRVLTVIAVWICWVLYTFWRTSKIRAWKLHQDKED